MKVAYIVDTLRAGGTERSLIDLLPGLREGGVDPIVLTLHPSESDSLGSRLSELGVPTRQVEGDGRLAKILSVRRHLKSCSPDIVHSMLFEANLAARVASIGLGTSVLVSLVSTTYSSERLQDSRLDIRKVRAVQALDALLARFLTDHFHAVSTAVSLDAMAGLRIRNERITVIERGRPLSDFPQPTPEGRTDARREFGVSDDALVLVNVGRQVFAKGQRYLIEAAAELRGRRDIAVLIAGREGPETAVLRQLVAALPSDAPSVRFLGYRADVAKVLAASDLFVFPSLFEGMPGSVIEAMAVGLPIVASDIDAVRSVVEPERNAVLVPVRDARALASAIEGLAANPQRREAMRSENRARFEERFTMDRSVKSFLTLYAKLEAAAPSGGG